MDDFDEIVSGIEDTDGEPESYRDLTDVQLMRAFFAVKRDLLGRGVLLHPSEEEDVDKQANYYGMIQEMNRRGLR